MANNSSSLYKRYLEPNCDLIQRTNPRKTKYHKNLKRNCTSENELQILTPSACGEVANSDSGDAVQNISILTEVSFI